MRRFFSFLTAVMLILMFAGPAASARHFGLKAGLNLSDPKGGDVKDNMGYQAGIVFQHELPLWFSIQPEIMFHVKGGFAQGVNHSVPFGLGYIEIPVNLQWGPSFNEGTIRPFVQATPYIGYAISKDIKNPATGKDYPWDGINRFEYGAGLGLGIQLWHFQISAQYNWNLGNLMNADFADLEMKEIFSKSNFGGYTISLAILF